MFISATITPHLRKQIELFVKLPQLKQFESKHVNVVMPHVPQIFMRIGKSHKPGKLLEKVKIDNKRCILVFCNDCRTTCWLSNFLKANGVRSGYINSNLSPKEREQVLLDFNNGVIQCLCATDAMSKGIDTQWVDNVINYDFPVDIKDYIHRAGRVGRLSPKQMDILVTNFISCKKEAGTAQRIEMSVRGMSNLSESIDELSLND
ncbi:hypothetical protein GJ496_002368 [Pomphorhynchus laevis]|nr:hypothetical protein GJ496_002368 [Pomphorhynchus laevis]